jgi:hypothetical protein
MVYETRGWDVTLNLVYAEYEDNIVCMWFDDCHPLSECAFPIISRTWCDVVGYYTPGIFEFGYNESGIADVGRRINIMHYISTVTTRHIHGGSNFESRDNTYYRNVRDNKWSRDKVLYKNTEHIRQRDADRLKAYIETQSETEEWHASNIYNEDSYFMRSDGIKHVQRGMLKYGDALCAIGYAMGISSFDEMDNMFSFKKYDKGAHINGMMPLPVMSAREQIDKIMSNRTRIPKHVLEIGSGRGEVAIALSSFADIRVTAVEPTSNFTKLLPFTAEKYHTDVSNKITVVNADAVNAIKHVEWDTVDTVLMVESLEHILEEDFDKVYPHIVSALKKNSGRLVIVNWLHYHPIAVGQYAPPDQPEQHCRLTDDRLYDQFSKDAREVIYRNGSHLVLDF